jgi:small subunit ribosomal protein S3e
VSRFALRPPSPTSVRLPDLSGYWRNAQERWDCDATRCSATGDQVLTCFSPVIRATHTQEVLGDQGRRIRELTSLVQKRFKFPENSVSLYAAKVQNRGLCAVAQCESLRYKLLNGLAVRRACYGVLRFIMESGAKGCEVVVSGKLRAARAKSMKFTDGFMIHSGQPVRDFIDSATRHVLLRQGVLGIKVKIMRGSDPEGKSGPAKSLPDTVTVIEPKEEAPITTPTSTDYV